MALKFVVCGILKEMKLRNNAAIAVIFGANLLVVQSGVRIVGAGHVDPSAIVLTPGQITTLSPRDGSG